MGFVFWETAVSPRPHVNCGWRPDTRCCEQTCWKLGKQFFFRIIPSARRRLCWCWKPANRLSLLRGIPIKRLSKYFFYRNFIQFAFKSDPFAIDKSHEEVVFWHCEIYELFAFLPQNSTEMGWKKNAERNETGLYFLPVRGARHLLRRENFCR